MKVAGSYASVVRGVSQQVPQDRFPGQHYQQTNFISDPVRGLARRHGSHRKGSKRLTNEVGTYATARADTARCKVLPTSYDGVEYDMIYRSTASAQGNLNFLHVFNKTSSQFLPVVYASGDAVVNALISGGVSAITGIGRYLLIAGHTVHPSFSQVDQQAATAEQATVWVRGGAYARTYTVAVTNTVNNTTYNASYTTPTSSYPGTLDTSGIPANDPEYQKKINDANAAYTTAVTQWIGTAATAITPQNIATQLRNGLVSAGITAANVDVANSTIIINIAGSRLDIQASDGGDGSAIRGVGQVVPAAELVSTIHYVGKVVKVQPKKTDGSDGYYLQAVATRTGVTGSTEVRWVETAGVRQTPTGVFAMGFVNNGTMYIASTAAGLQTISGVGGHPTFLPSDAGDLTSSPPPVFFGKRIDYLGLFQDRLVIAAGSTVFMSKTGDYFNFYRTSLLLDSADDPVEMYALGSEDDVIVAGTTYDRNLVLFGQKSQYTVSGRTPLTPSNASIVVMSTHEDSVDAFPINSGNLVFYTKYRNHKSSAHQIQIGLVQDSPESFEISRPLDSYLTGRPVEIVAVISPNTVVYRLTEERNRLFVYSFLDTQASQERVFDAWSDWKYDASLGSLVGLSRHDGDILTYWLRPGVDGTGAAGQWLVCDVQPLDSELAVQPYLDSWLYYNDQTPTDWRSSVPDTFGLALDKDSPSALIGVTQDRIPEFVEQYPTEMDRAVLGTLFEASVTPTNPYMRDRNDKVITTGRLVLSKILVTVANTGGLSGDIQTTNGVKPVLNFTGRRLGRTANVVGRHPIADTTIPLSVGRETKSVLYTLKSQRWLPLTITALEWVGQYFSNSRRV